MATLFERVAGLDENKIAIHLIRSCLSEISSERMTVAESALIMQLDGPQTADLVKVLAAASTSSSAGLFSSRVFAYLVLSELSRDKYYIDNGLLTSYTDETAFWAMIESEGAK